MYKVIDDVLHPNDLEHLRRQASGEYKSVDTGYAELKCRHPDKRINTLLTNVIKRETGYRGNELVAFLRRNRPTEDTAFRVHADGSPLGDGRLCTLAAVFYLETDDSGTALFEHHVHGRTVGSQYVFNEDDGWNPYFRCEAKADRLFVYDAKLFHGRYPWKVTQERIVLVKFLG
jgi:hypothetical protein